MTYCGELTAVKDQGDIALAVTLMCRRWGCDECGERRKAQVAAMVIAGEPNRLLTVTTRREPGKTDEQAGKELSRAFRLLRKRVMRRLRLKSLPFFCVMERHQSGWPHLHIMLRCPYLDWQMLVEMWEEITGSRGVHIQYINNRKQAASYAAKYMTKCVEKIGTCKRYWQSRDYCLHLKEEDLKRIDVPSPWSVFKRPLKEIAEEWLRRGLSVEWLSDRMAVARTPALVPPPRAPPWAA